MQRVCPCARSDVNRRMPHPTDSNVTDILSGTTCRPLALSLTTVPGMGAAAMVTSCCSVLLACAHARFPRPRPRPPPSPILTRAAAVAVVTMARANAPLFVRRPGGTGRRCRGCSQICRDSSIDGPPPGGDSSAREQEEDKKKSEAAAATAARIAASGGGARLSDWTTSALLFGVWAGILYYIFQLAPNQTPYRDTYFLEKLLNLKGDDGFRMNEVLVSLWYIMALWPLVYSMLLLPTGRSSKSKIPAWPFLVLSCVGGAYALIPYFVLWKPPPPPIDEDEIGQWPLKFLESKLTAGVMLALGLGLIIYAGKASGDDWKEFIRYFRESRFIHTTCLDFALLSAFSPFWVYNDMTARRWKNGSWLLPLSLIPFVGPSLYLLLRPSLSSLLEASSSSANEIEK